MKKELIALCAIGRMENRYAREFVKYYVDLGFDKIFIYDNNFGQEEHFEDVLEMEIAAGQVEVIDYRDIPNAQKAAYNDCYLKHGDEYEWIAFFDFDEFLTIGSLYLHAGRRFRVKDWRRIFQRGIRMPDPRAIVFERCHFREN